MRRQSSRAALMTTPARGRLGAPLPSAAASLARRFFSSEPSALSHRMDATPPTMAATPTLLPSPALWPQHAIVLTKTARWRHLPESARQHGRHETARRACQAHEQAVESISNAMRAAGIIARAQDARDDVAASDLAWADVCFALGGDGTTLRAAHAAPAGMCVVGVNTDPQRSVGKLCSATVGPGDPDADAHALVETLVHGAYRERLVPRLRVALELDDADDDAHHDHHPGGAGSAAPPLTPPLTPPTVHAINECFISELDPSRPIDLEVRVDGGPWVAWRSSGAIISTQLGAGAWMQHACAVREAQITAVLNAATELGLVGGRCEVAKLDESQLGAIVAKANAALVQHDDPCALQFLVREPVTRALSGAGSDGVRPAHGLASRVQVRPSGWHVVASLDGLPPTTLPKGSVLDMRIEPDRGQWLRTIEPILDS